MKEAASGGEEEPAESDEEVAHRATRPQRSAVDDIFDSDEDD